MKPIPIFVSCALALGFNQGVAMSGPDTQFDFMLGEWQSESIWMNPDQTFRTVRARHTFSKAFSGQGLVDDNYDIDDQQELIYTGTAIRTFDTARGVWVCRWYDGKRRAWQPEFELRWEDGRMLGTLSSQDEHGAYADTIQFLPVDRDRVEWTMVRRYEGLDRDFVIGEIEYRRIAMDER